MSDEQKDQQDEVEAHSAGLKWDRPSAVDEPDEDSEVEAHGSTFDSPSYDSPSYDSPSYD